MKIYLEFNDVYKSKVTISEDERETRISIICKYDIYLDVARAKKMVVALEKFIKENDRTVGKLLEKLRKEHKLTTKEMAEILKVSPNVYRLIIKDERDLWHSEIMAISDRFTISANDIIRGSK